MEDTTGDVRNTISGGTAGAVFQAHTLNVNLHLGSAPPRPTPPAEDETGFPLPDIERCLAKLGVPSDDLGAATDYVVRRVLSTDGRAPLSIALPVQVKDKVEEFVTGLESFTRPHEWYFATLSYLSYSKIAAIYGVHRHHLGDETEAVDRFHRLHHYLAKQRLLAFGPALLLLDEPLPSGDDTWLYFMGAFRLRLDLAELQGIPRAQEIVGSGNRRNALHLTNLIFNHPDPFFVPLLELEGSIGPHQVTMVLSRRHLVVGSSTAISFSRALFGDPILLDGFGTFHPQQCELRPIVLHDMSR